MKIYFLSSQPCALTINGGYFGITDHFSRFAEISLKDNLLATFTPQDALPSSLFINEELLFNPPKNFEVYLLKEGMAIYAKKFPPNDYTLKPVCQTRLENCLATLFWQGELHLSLEWENNLFIATLPPSFHNSSLSFYQNLLFVEGENRLAVFDKRGNCLLQEEISCFSVENDRLNATLPLFDSLQCVAECSWSIQEEKLVKEEFSIKVGKEEYIEKLFAYAFFESLLYGGNWTRFLSDELLLEKEKLQAFIGDFAGVQLTDNPLCCALLRRKEENLYEAAYFFVEIKDGKICDIKG